MHMQGIFISFEGVDGVGKTTQVERLRAWLESTGREVVVTREPGGTELGRSIRRLLLQGGQQEADIAPRALERGAVVITDRYIDSSLAYQAGGRELTAEAIGNLSRWASEGLMPERTYLLDMDPALSHARLQHGQDRMESAGDGFQRRTRQAFLDLAAAQPDRFLVVDADRSPEDVWDRIQGDAERMIARYGRR